MTVEVEESTVEPQGEPVETPQGEPTETPGSVELAKVIAESRKWEKRAKTDAKRLEAAQAALTESTTQTDAQTDAANQRATEAALVAERYKVAIKHSLPVELAVRLVGDTPEEIEQDATSLAALLKPTAPAPNRGAGAKQSATTPRDANSLLRDMVN